MLFHNRQMYGVARGQTRVTKNNLFRSLEYGVVDSEYLVDHAKKRVKCWLDGVSAVDCDVAVQYLLKYFGVCDQTLAATQ